MARPLRERLPSHSALIPVSVPGCLLAVLAGRALAMGFFKQLARPGAWKCKEGQTAS